MRVRLCHINEITPGEMRQIAVPGRPPLAVVRLGDEFHVVDDTCTHGEASLSDGYLEDGEIECPWHSGRFDLRTGKPTNLPCVIPLCVYAAVVDGADLFVELADPPSGTPGANESGSSQSLLRPFQS